MLSSAGLEVARSVVTASGERTGADEERGHPLLCEWREKPHFTVTSVLFRLEVAGNDASRLLLRSKSHQGT